MQLGPETYATVYSLVESLRTPGEIWSGGDGLVHLTRDGGEHWVDITPSDMLEWTMVTGIELSPFVDGKAYLCGTRYKTDDYRPYLWVTTDHGSSWSRIDQDLPKLSSPRVLRADRSPLDCSTWARSWASMSPSTTANRGNPFSSIFRWRRCSSS